MRLNKGIIGLMVASTVLIWSCSKTGTSVDPVVGPKGTAVDKLAKGINLSNWFNDYSDAGHPTVTIIPITNKLKTQDLLM